MSATTLLNPTGMSVMQTVSNHEIGGLLTSSFPTLIPAAGSQDTASPRAIGRGAPTGQIITFSKRSRLARWFTEPLQDGCSDRELNVLAPTSM